MEGRPTPTDTLLRIMGAPSLVRHDGFVHVFLNMVLNGAYAQCVIPDTWQYAMGALLGKNIGKLGCVAIRIISL